MGKYLDSTGLAHLIGKIKTALSGKQATLVSGTNIKTVNNQSLLGSGNITISGGSSLPSGGAANDVLAKNSSTEGDLKWLTLGEAASLDSSDFGALAWEDSLTYSDVGAAAAQHSHSEYFSSTVNRTANTVLAAPNGSNGHASFRKLVAADLPDLSGSYLPLSGGNLTGNLGVKSVLTLGSNTTAEENGIKLKGGGTRNGWVLRTISAANGDGDAVLLGDGGMTIVGGGESAANLWTALGVSAGTEQLHLAADSSVFIHPNCQTVADRYSWEFNTSGNLSGPDGGSYVANDGQFYADSDGLTSGTHPSTETAGRGVIFRDSNNAIIGAIQPRFGTSSQEWQALRLYSQRKIGTADKYNILDLRVDDDGNQVVYTNNAAAWRSALGLGTAATHAASYFQQEHDYYAASSATNVTVANTSLYRFLVILFRTNSATYTGGGASAAASPLNSTMVHINKKSSGSVYVSLMGAHAMSGTSVQIRTGLATVTCSATAGKVTLSNQRYINLGNGSSGTKEVGTQTDMALVGVIGIY